MRILTINVIGIPSGIDSNLAEANVFQDYDAVIVNPSSLQALYASRIVDYIHQNHNELTRESGSLISSLNYERHKQANGLLQQGGVIVCFVHPPLNYNYNTTRQNRKLRYGITNYDWLFENLHLEFGFISAGKGTKIDYINLGHPFTDYLNTKPNWSAYIDQRTCEDWIVLASAFGTHAVALTKRVGIGHIVLLPSYYDHHNGRLLEQCITKLMGHREPRPQPNWSKSMLVPGQESIISEITKVNEQAATLEKKRANLIDDNDKLERWKYLLYEKGKHHLEPVVREALALLGCQVEPQADKDADGLVACDYGKALLEVVGSEGTIKIEKLGQLTRNMSSFFEARKSKVKGILVANPFCSEPLDNRPPKDTQKQLFGKELIEGAEQLSITILLSTDLYEAVCRILGSKLSKAEEDSLQERIFKGKGLVRLFT